MKRWTFGLLAGLAALLGSSATVAAGGAAVAGASVAPIPLLRLVSHTAFVTPPTTADCVQQIGIACYSPAQFQRAYNLHPLYKKGLTGKGQTIVIVDSYGYANIRHELRVFDRGFHLPPPPSFRIIHPAGPIPPFNPKKRPDMVGWAEETSLDVQYSHAMAPGANILLVETPVDETLGVQGFPQIVEAENYVVNHHLGNVISQSFGAPEAGFPSAHSILALRSAYKNAARHGVSVLAGSGDAGASGEKTLAPTFFDHRAPSWPPTDPLVTAVGGTQLHLDAKGNRTAPDNVWNDQALFGGPAASGGGLSTVFGRPWYQHLVAGVVDSHRGIPDVSMSAAVDGAALVFLDKGAAQGAAGFYLIGGTSEASPEFAGVVAIADQWAGHGLGLLNPALYRMEAAGKPGIVDVTSGNNTVSFTQGGSTHTVVGFNAGPGYDLASGVGTINAARFVPELVRASHHH
jgi:subtilase family serine protease